MAELQTLEGEVLGFVEGKYGIRNRCRLKTAQGETLVKFPKEWAPRIAATVAVGDRVQVRGKLKCDDEGETYLKANVFLHLKSAAPVLSSAPAAPSEPIAPVPSETTAPAVPPPLPSARVLVCTSSDCCKRGARAVVHNLEEAIARYGLDVEIEKTGCMKRCKQGPTLIIQPGKVRHTHVAPEQAGELLLRQLLPRLE